jgi:hypothetical protein
MVAPITPITPPDTLAIGEIDQTVFDCPKCGRPLAVGARRGPGCRTRLVIGIPLSKVAILASSGIAIGLLVGIGIGFGLGLLRPAAAPVTAQTPIATAAPVASVQAGGTGTTGTGNTGGTGSGGTGVPEMPALTRSALTQALAVDARLAGGASSLRAALSASPFNASEVAKILRALAADAVIGRQLADHVTAWSGSATVGTNLDTVYDSVHTTATEALVNSVRNEGAYRAAATEMLSVLAGLAPADGAARALAGQSGIDLPATTP